MLEARSSRHDKNDVLVSDHNPERLMAISHANRVPRPVRARLASSGASRDHASPHHGTDLALTELVTRGRAHWQRSFT
jgi:hypothetical protein